MLVVANFMETNARYINRIGIDIKCTSACLHSGDDHLLTLAEGWQRNITNGCQGLRCPHYIARASFVIVKPFSIE